MTIFGAPMTSKRSTWWKKEKADCGVMNSSGVKNGLKSLIVLLPGTFNSLICLRRPETFSRKGFWTSKSFLLEWFLIHYFFSFFPSFLSSQFPSFPLFASLCVSLWLKLDGGFKTLKIIKKTGTILSLQRTW